MEKTGDLEGVTRQKMYYSRNTSELFLSGNANPYPQMAISEMIEYLLANPELQGKPVKLYRKLDGSIQCVPSDKKPLTDYPINPNLPVYLKEGCIMIAEPPIPDAPPYLYICGCDPYNISESLTSNSVGSMYVYKRMYDPVGGTFQRSIVAYYVGRPEQLDDFHANCELLAEYYNAIILPENSGSKFISYFDLKDKGYMIADTVNFFRQISPSTKIVGNPKGLPATTRVKEFYGQLVLAYAREEIDTGLDDKQGNRIKRLGITRIPDAGLLRELQSYDPKKNLDRYVGFGHTLALEIWCDKMYPIVKSTNQEPPKEETPPVF